METDLKETEKNLEALSSQKKQLNLDSAKWQKELDEVRF